MRFAKSPDNYEHYVIISFKILSTFSHHVPYILTNENGGRELKSINFRCCLDAGKQITQEHWIIT